MLPLLPLTKNGARREIVEEMITALQAANKEDLLPIAYAVAALVFTRREDKKWLKWRFDMLEDIIEESWAYQEMVEKGFIKGQKEGRKEGQKEGQKEGRKEERAERLRGLRQTLQELVSNLFPSLVTETQQNTELIQDPEVLQHLIVEIALAQTAEEARCLLSEAASKK